jgi:hypothetical protein
VARIFLSYSRHDADAANFIAKDLVDLNHSPWYDQELSGGQAWWEQILANIRECDFFIFILSQSSLDSAACQLEYDYAAKLNCPILPLLVGDNVGFNLLPPALSQIQFLDYRKRNDDRATAIISLLKSLNSLPARSPLPTPLPTPPEVPISYLGKLAQKISFESILSREDQSQLVLDLKAGVRDPATHEDTRVLLQRMRQHPYVLASIAQEIDEILNEKVAALQDSQASPKAARAPARRERPPARLSDAQLEQPAPNRMASNISHDGRAPFLENLRKAWANNSQLYSRLAGALISLLAFMTLAFHSNGYNGSLKFFGLLLMTRGLLGWLEHPRAYAFVRPWGQIVSAIYIAYAWIGITLFLFPVYQLMPIFIILTIADVLAQLMLTISHRQQHLSNWRLAFWCTAFTYVAIFSLLFFSQPVKATVVFVIMPMWIFAYALLKILFGGNLLY